MARPQAMWAAAFSSKSVLLKVTPVSPTRDEASTSATSPKRRAPSSMASSARRASSPRRGARLDDLPARDAQLEALDDRAAQRERHRAADRALGAQAVRAGEDLLGRQVRRVDLAVHGALAAGQPARALDQPDLEVGARGRGSAAR